MFVNTEKFIRYELVENVEGKRVTFLCGDAGPLALAAVIYSGSKLIINSSF